MTNPYRWGCSLDLDKYKHLFKDEASFDLMVNLLKMNGSGMQYMVIHNDSRADTIGVMISPEEAMRIRDL